MNIDFMTKKILIKTGQEAQKLLNELETEFTGKKR